MNQELKTAILKTLCHFAVLEYPLTLLELQKFLTCRANFSEILAVLSVLSVAGIIEQKDGFYFLPAPTDLVSQRLSRYSLAVKKFQRAQRIVMLLKYFPWVRALAVYSSLAFYNCRRASDIDLFVITSSGRLWSARFFINSFLKIFRLRPGEGGVADKIFVSYLVSEAGLNLVAAQAGWDDYFYNYFGPASFTFLFGEEGVISAFFQSNNWLQKIMPNWQPITYNQMPPLKPNRQFFKNIFTKVVAIISEEKYQQLQLAILPRRYRAIQNQDQRVIISSQMIKLHDHDRAPELNRLFTEKFHNFFHHAD